MPGREGRGLRFVHSGFGIDSSFWSRHSDFPTKEIPMSFLKAPRASKKRNNNSVNNPDRTVPIKVSDVSVAGSVATVEFDQSVLLSGTPAYTTSVAGATAVSAEQTSPTTIE